MPGKQAISHTKRTDLREACVGEAYNIIAEVGVDKLSLREVSRRLGVSHQAPYKHFPSRDHILAEVIARAFNDFAGYLQDRQTDVDPNADLCAMGECYMGYADAHPLEYRLMFNTALPSPRDHPAMMRNAKRAFTLLRDRLAGMVLRDVDGIGPAPNLDALFVWSTLHGIASIMQSDVIETLDLSDEEFAQILPRIMARIGAALAPIEPAD
jgi:AcrR family transcriptional regulator